MYVAFGDTILDSNEIKNIIETNSDFKVVKDMCKGSKRDDVLAFNISLSTKILDEMLSDEFNKEQLTEDELFLEYLEAAEEFATDLEEFLSEGALLDIKAYKWDESDGDIKLVVAIVHEELGEIKLKDIMRRLLKQVE